MLEKTNDIYISLWGSPWHGRSNVDIPDRVRLHHNSKPDTVLTHKLYFRPAVNFDETATADLQI